MQPQWLIRQYLNTLYQERNLNQLTQAQSCLMFANANRGRNDPPFSDISMFLPHPHIWILRAKKDRLNISRQTALEFIQSLNWLKSEDISMVFDDWMRDIQAIAIGDV